MERPKTYCIVRKDLSPTLQSTQARQAIEAATAKFGCAAGEVVLLAVGNEHELLQEFMTVKNSAVCKFAPELDGFTSFATFTFNENSTRFRHLERLSADGLRPQAPHPTPSC
jgi:hypothetical protein